MDQLKGLNNERRMLYLVCFLVYGQHLVQSQLSQWCLTHPASQSRPHSERLSMYSAHSQMYNLLVMRRHLMIAVCHQWQCHHRNRCRGYPQTPPERKTVSLLRKLKTLLRLYLGTKWLQNEYMYTDQNTSTASICDKNWYMKIFQNVFFRMCLLWWLRCYGYLIILW